MDVLDILEVLDEPVGLDADGLYDLALKGDVGAGIDGLEGLGLRDFDEP